MHWISLCDFEISTKKKNTTGEIVFFFSSIETSEKNQKHEISNKCFNIAFKKYKIRY